MKLGRFIVTNMEGEVLGQYNVAIIKENLDERFLDDALQGVDYAYTDKEFAKLDGCLTIEYAVLRDINVSGTVRFKDKG